MILSLQGCMAVGKTTALRHLQITAPYLHVSWEDQRDVIAEVQRRGLDKNRYEHYLEIQRLWLNNEVRRHEEALSYPRSIGEDWDVEGPLRAELEAVRECLPDRILFLDASDETLRAHKAGDPTRGRRFFEQHLQTLLPLKREWFRQRDNVDWLRVDGLSSDEVGERVRRWCDARIGRA